MKTSLECDTKASRLSKSHGHFTEEYPNQFNYLGHYLFTPGSNFPTHPSLTGAGDPRWVMYITIFGLWLFRLPLAYFLGVTMGYGVFGAWVAMIIDIFIRSIVLGYRFKSKKWMEIKV